MPKAKPQGKPANKAKQQAAQAAAVSNVAEELRLVQRHIVAHMNSLKRLAIQVSELVEVLEATHPFPDEALTPLRVAERQLEAELDATELEEDDA